VGGGGVGTRKVGTLLTCGALVTVVSPEISDDLQARHDSGQIIWICRGYDKGDLLGKFLVIGATSDEKLNRQIHRDAEALNLLCNIADRPKACNFILPSIVERGDLLIAVSTSGKSPAFAKKLRRELAARYGGEYAQFLKLMGAIRAKLLREEHAPEAHKPLFNQLIDGGLLELIRDQRDDDINALMARVLGDGFSLKSLLNTNK
jgi:precorrin-2 dehydrogenase/sirohydrochlorin ferrochelatase